MAFLVRCPRCDSDFMDYAEQDVCPRCTKGAKRVRRNGRQRQSNRDKRTRFVAVDGEGVTHDDGSHDYVLLTVGDRSFHRDGRRLTYSEVFGFIWECFLDDPGSAYVGFFLGYDFTHWLRTLPENRARMLLDSKAIALRQRRSSGKNPVPFPVYIGDEWQCDILGTKRFKLKHADSKRWMYVCDAGPFFQTSFLNAINPKGWSEPICTPEEYQIIADGKVIRSTAVLDDNMIRYNRMENAILSRLMGKLDDGFRSAGIELKRDQWYGPGQAAQKWLTKIGAATRDELNDKIPAYARAAGQASYYGGWFEIMAHGIVPGESYEYDINSAYPHAISQLPDWIDGEWSHLTLGGVEYASRDFLSAPASKYMLMDAEVRGSDANIGAMPYRTDDGKICRPHHTRGWYWKTELDAAIQAGLIDSVKVFEVVSFVPHHERYPFASIADLYQQRLVVGKDSPSGKALKLMYNSAYGKMAQSIGEPKYASSLYASLITSHCRTAILRAIATHPRKSDAVLMVATDGIYFDAPHPSLPVSRTTLGCWDGKVKQRLTLFMPGIYWDDDARTRLQNGDDIKLKSRGINGKDLGARILDVDAQFERFATGGQDWPRIEVPIQFEMVTATQALARNDWSLCGRVNSPDIARARGVEPPVKVLDSNPHTKRVGPVGTRNGRILSAPYPEGPSGITSVPYDRRFGDEMAAELLMHGISPEGVPFTHDLPALLRGDD